MNIDFDLFTKLAKDYDREWKIRDLYNSMIADSLDTEFDVGVTYYENSQEFVCDAVNFRINQRNVKDYDELHDMIKAKLSENVDSAKLKNKFHYFFTETGVESKVGEFHDYSRVSFDSQQFFDLLWYLKTDELRRDGSKGSELMNQAQAYADKYPNDSATYFLPKDFLQYQIRYGSWIDLTTVDSKFSGLQIKFFQNRKVQMKGLSNEDWDKIVAIDKIVNER